MKINKKSNELSMAKLNQGISVKSNAVIGVCHFFLSSKMEQTEFDKSDFEKKFEF